MDNKAFDDSDTDIATENEKNVENVGKDEPSEVNDINDKKEELEEMTNDEKERERKKKISAEMEEKVEIYDKLVMHETPVTDSITPVEETIPNPPPRHRTRSKASVETKADGDTHGGVHRERKQDTMENQKCKEEEATQMNTPETDTRNRGKKTNPPKPDKGEIKLTVNENGKKVEASDIEKSESSVRLKQELGLLNCVGLIVGNIIGTGIFVSPRAVVQYTGSVGMSLIVWLISGIMSIVGALCYAELGTMIPQSGGNYTYLHEAYGPLPAFILLWMTVTISIPGSRAVAALSFANYVVQPFFPNEQTPPQSALRIIGILLIHTPSFPGTQRRP